MNQIKGVKMSNALYRVSRYSKHGLEKEFWNFSKQEMDYPKDLNSLDHVTRDRKEAEDRFNRIYAVNHSVFLDHCEVDRETGNLKRISTILFRAS